jgi:L-lactate dehydrogenase complex protein LldG
MVRDAGQDEFIQTVRKAIGDRSRPIERPDDLSVARVVRDRDDLVAKFCQMATDAKMKLHRIKGTPGLVDTVLNVVTQIRARSAVITEEPFDEREGLIERLQQAGCAMLDLRDADAPFQADVGITPARMAVAETGSIVVASGPATRRLASLAVPEHIAIVRKDQIVADLLDWARTLHADSIPSNDVLITGPSKTADIEMNLVMGVHGPRNVHVVLIE